MDQTQLIVELARQIEAQQAYHQIWFWLLLTGVSGVAGAIGAFGSSYFAKRGETSAIEADIRKIREQQATITAAVETVKTAIEHDDWKRKELLTLRRLKLEELMAATSDVPDWTLESTYSIWHGRAKPTRPNPQTDVDWISEAYFPDISLAMIRLSSWQSGLFIIVQKEQTRRLLAAQGDALPPVDSTASKRMHLAYGVLRVQRDIVLDACARKIDKILGDAPEGRIDYIPRRDRALVHLRAALAGDEELIKLFADAPPPD